MINLVLFGSPGAGKGTQAERLKSKFGLTHISTGDLFRYHIKHETPLGKRVKHYLDDGQLVPDKLTIDILESEVNKNANSNGFIFDGFPRTIPQAVELDKFLATKKAEVNAMIALEVDDDVLVKRLLDRGKESGRKDDASEDIVRKRIRVYYEQTDIVKSYYQKADKFFGVDGIGSMDEITERLSRIIENLMD